MQKPKTINELTKNKQNTKPYWGAFLRPKEKVFLVAPPKKQKTFFGVQLAASLACGINFLDFKTIQAKVMYLNLEMDEQMIGKRFNDVATSIHAPSDVLKPNLLVVSDWELRLDSSDSQKEMINEIRKNESKIVFVDPLQKAIDGSDSREMDMRRFINGVERIIRKTGAAFFIIHHTPKIIRSTEPVFAGRGHSILPGWADTSFLLESKKLTVTARATSIDPIKINFDYPVWQAVDWKSKVEYAQLEIIRLLKKTPRKKMARLKLERMIEASDWAFKEALKGLKKQKDIKILRIKGTQYNQKIIVLVE